MSNINFVVFLGPPGAGKGTLSSLCMRKHNWSQLSVGDLLRKHIDEGTPLGQEIDFTVKSGKLINDKLVIKIVQDWLLQQPEDDRTIILDGFPRTANQAIELHHEIIRKADGVCNINVIRLQISNEMIIERLLSRKTCSNKLCQTTYSTCKESGLLPEAEESCDLCGESLVIREDDNKDTILNRLQLYKDHEQSIVNVYEQLKYPLHSINAAMSLDNVYNELINRLGITFS